MRPQRGLILNADWLKGVDSFPITAALAGVLPVKQITSLYECAILMHKVSSVSALL